MLGDRGRTTTPPTCSSSTVRDGRLAERRTLLPREHRRRARVRACCGAFALEYYGGQVGDPPLGRRAGRVRGRRSAGGRSWPSVAARASRCASRRAARSAAWSSWPRATPSSRSSTTRSLRAAHAGAADRGARGAARGAQPRGAAGADRVLRHLQPGRVERGRVDGRVRGRRRQALRLPQVHDPPRAAGRTTSLGSPRRCGRRFARMTAGRGRRATTAASRRAPNLVVIDGGKGQLGGGARGDGRVRPAARRGDLAGQARGGGLRAGARGADRARARLGRPAAAAARCATRRTASRSASTASAGRGPRRLDLRRDLPGVGAGAAPRAVAPLRDGRRAAEREPRASSRPSPACRPRSGAASTSRCTAPAEANPPRPASYEAWRVTGAPARERHPLVGVDAGGLAQQSRCVAAAPLKCIGTPSHSLPTSARSPGARGCVESRPPGLQPRWRARPEHPVRLLARQCRRVAVDSRSMPSKPGIARARPMPGRLYAAGVRQALADSAAAAPARCRRRSPRARSTSRTVRTGTPARGRARARRRFAAGAPARIEHPLAAAGRRTAPPQAR